MGQSLRKFMKENKSSEGNIVKKDVKKYGLTRIVEDLVSSEIIVTSLATHFGTQKFLLPISLACGAIALTCGVFLANMASTMFKKKKKTLPAPRIRSVIILCQDEDGNLVAVTPPAPPAP